MAKLEIVDNNWGERVVAVREILLLGNKNLYEICEEVSKDEINSVGITKYTV